MANYAQVTAVHPEANSIDVIMNNGRVIAGVKVLSISSSGDSGQRDLPNPADGNLALAVIEFIDGTSNAVCLGFLPANQNSVSFPDNRAINVHHSGAYVTIDANANVEVFHPSGGYLRIGVGDHEDLTGLDYHEKFAVTKNTGLEISAMLVAGGNSIVVSGAGISLNGPVTASSTITATGDVMGNSISLDHHKHGGVMAGGDNSGEPAA